LVSCGLTERNFAALVHVLATFRRKNALSDIGPATYTQRIWSSVVI
jgi:hypothetical protein